MKEQFRKTLRSVCRSAPTAALATGVLCPSVYADTGDLDPAFGTIGRLIVEGALFGTAFSVQTQDDDIIFAGGEDNFYTMPYDPTGFVSRLSGIGAIDASFAAPSLDGIKVADTAVQTDAKIVGVGRTHFNQVLLRTEPDGSPHMTFAGHRLRPLPQPT